MSSKPRRRYGFDNDNTSYAANRTKERVSELKSDRERNKIKALQADNARRTKELSNSSEPIDMLGDFPDSLDSLDSFNSPAKASEDLVENYPQGENRSDNLSNPNFEEFRTSTDSLDLNELYDNLPPKFKAFQPDSAALCADGENSNSINSQLLSHDENVSHDNKNVRITADEFESGMHIEVTPPGSEEGFESRPVSARRDKDKKHFVGYETSFDATLGGLGDASEDGADTTVYSDRDGASYEKKDTYVENSFETKDHYEREKDASYYSNDEFQQEDDFLDALHDAIGRSSEVKGFLQEVFNCIGVKDIFDDDSFDLVQTKTRPATTIGKFLDYSEPGKCSEPSKYSEPGKKISSRKKRRDKRDS
mmetsp:Transcript_32800/g.65002  ORF Transcript_32800/g.65002 Transcript_32800/m.65002 type:complete len:365 (-) Transcript_32800:326-1420(-)|eukprot:CAMPEP_0194335590 /NCGR_PEP_ID=MMETSP0171-20130528/70054_1 /TAXON_ID=218684 /ORGANISM="Corethron pennatum, Strain L29A3" /LENGTH=364 /DNA_ID=CAMNT_0039098739 /DNA_START=132 /DNA_END=1226 /DNA_ORIENTATION=+